MRYRSPTPSRSRKPMRWRAIAAAPRAPGASVGDSSSMVASPRAAWTRGESAHSRAMRVGSVREGRPGGGDAAADDDAPDAEGQGERSDRPGEVVGHAVDDLDRDLVAGGTRRGTRPRHSSRATGLVLRPAATASSACRAIAGPAAIVSRQPRRPHAQTTPSGSATTWPTSPAKLLSPRSNAPSRTMPAEMPVPIARKATLAGAVSRPVGRLLAQPERRRAGVVLDEDRDAQLRLQHRSQRQVGDAQVDGHADRAVRRVDLAGDGDADRGDVLPELAPGVVDESGDLVDQRRPDRSARRARRGCGPGRR